MIARQRLYEADKHAKRRAWAFQSDDWQRMRKVTQHYPCVLCGNPRRWFGEVTRQEKRERERESE